MMLRGLQAGARGYLLKDTDRETLLDTIMAAANGNRNKEIAYKFSISERTVKAHLTSIYNKFGVDSRAASVAIATQMDLLKHTE